MHDRFSALILIIILLAGIAVPGFGQVDGEAAYAAFVSWKSAVENRSLPWEAATEKYSAS